MKKKNWKRLQFLQQDHPVDLRYKYKRSNTFCHYCNSLGHKPGYCGTHIKVIILDGYENANQVELFCKNSDWKVGQRMYQQNNSWYTKIKLNHGKQEFKFLVDKKNWVVSERYKTLYNTLGTQNNYIYIIPAREEDYIILQRGNSLKDKNILKIEFELNQWSLEKMLNQLNINQENIQDVYIEIWGDWNQWSQGQQMILTNKNENCKVWVCILNIPYNKLLYKFKVNNQWVLDPYREVVDDGMIENHIFDPIQNKIQLSEDDSIQKIDILKTKVDVKQIKIQEMQTMDLWGHSLNLINKQIFIIGGVGRNSYTNLIYKVNPQNYTIQCIDMDDQNGPDLLAFHKTICYGQKIIVYGGQNEYQISNKYHTFNCVTQKWTSFKFQHNNHKREHFSAVLKKGTCRVFFFGGYYFHPDSKEDKMFDDLLMLNLKLMNFIKIDSKNNPEARCHHSSIMRGWNMFIYGGCNISNYLRKVFDDIYKINLSLDSDYVWQKIDVKGTKPKARYGHMALKKDEYMIIHGGKTSEDGIREKFLDDLWVFNMDKLNWIQIELQNVQLQRAFHDGCIFNNKIIFFGGKYSNKFCHRDPNIFYEIDLFNSDDDVDNNQQNLSLFNQNLLIIMESKNQKKKSIGEQFKDVGQQISQRFLKALDEASQQTQQFGNQIAHQLEESKNCTQKELQRTFEIKKKELEDANKKTKQQFENAFKSNNQKQQQVDSSTQTD